MGRDSLVPDVAIIKIYFVTIRKQLELVLERDLAVVLFLIGDVSFDLLDVGLADGIRTVPGLPVGGNLAPMGLLV